MTEFGVRDENALVNDGGTNPSTERGEDHEALVLLRGAVEGFGVAGSIRIVDEGDVAIKPLFKQLLGFETDPLF